MACVIPLLVPMMSALVMSLPWLRSLALDEEHFDLMALELDACITEYEDYMGNFTCDIDVILDQC